MDRQNLANELDRQIERLVAGEPPLTVGFGDLLAIAADCQMLAHPKFRAQLRMELVEETRAANQSVWNANGHQVTSTMALAEILPTLGGKQFGIFPADQRSFLASFASHLALIALIASGIWVGHSTMVKPVTSSSDLVFPIAGGGGGGDHSIISAPRGTPPKFSDQQFAPPVIVVRKIDPKLRMQPTLLGPPEIKLPQSNKIGDLVSSNVVFPSNGSGSGPGAGSGNGPGLGGGVGPGAGEGSNGGAGGSAYTVGHGVTAPRAIYDPEPEYSEEARKLKQQGVVVLSLIVDANGHARNLRVARSLGMGLDEKAIEAVKNWKFHPATKDELPVAVQVNVEVNFRLY